MENGRAIADDVRPSEVEHEFSSTSSSSSSSSSASSSSSPPRTEMIGTNNASETQPEVKNSVENEVFEVSMGGVDDDANTPLEQPQFTPVAPRDEENNGKHYEDDRIGSSEGIGGNFETGKHEISSAAVDDTENKSDVSAGELHDRLLNGGGTDFEDEEISAVNVKNDREREVNEEFVVERNANGAIFSMITTSDDSDKQLPLPLIEPENDSFKGAVEGLDSGNSYASASFSRKDNGSHSVTSVNKLGEGEIEHEHSNGEVDQQQSNGVDKIIGSDVKPKEGGEPLEEPVRADYAKEASFSHENINRTLEKPSSVADSSQKGSSGSATRSHPAGLGSSAPLLESSARPVQHLRANGTVSKPRPQPSEDVSGGDTEEYDETREKLQMIRVKFLRLAHRLGQTPHNVVVAQVLYRLGLAEQLRGSMNISRAGAISFDRASAMAEQLEAAGQEPLDFSCTIMVIGKTGVGKSATINSIFDKVTSKTDPFQPGTTKVQDINGRVQGIKLRIIDTPGLSPSSSDQPKNERILHSIKHFIKKTPPDVVMYLDRLDVQNRDLGDVPLLRTITHVFGPSIWFNAIVVLTHAASAPPDGPNGVPLSYEMYVTQRSHVIQQAVRQAAGDQRILNPVSLVENHSACRLNRAGQRVLPSGQVWKPDLLLLSFASKILTEANTLLNLQDSQVGRSFATRFKAPRLPFFLSSLLQSRAQLKMPEDDEDMLDIETDEQYESGDEYDYDELPPFKTLTKEQLSNLSKLQRKAYFEELDYREKLFYRKQMKEEKRRRKQLKKMAAEAKDLPQEHHNIEEDNSSPASVPVPMPDLPLPASFDSDYPSHRYRFLDSPNQWLVRPVLETQAWDHDVGYEGVNVEKLFVVHEKIPVSLSGQLTKDKKDCNLQMEMASSLKHGKGKSTSLVMDMQTVGKDMAYTFRGETEFCNFRRNSTSAVLSASFLGDTSSAGIKVEDKLNLNKRFKLLTSAGGAMTGRGEVAYGGRLEATLRDKDYPLGSALSTLALSIVDWHGDLAVGCNLQSQVPVGRHTNVTGHANLSNRGSGQVGIRINSSEHLQLVLVALIPFFKNARRLFLGSSESM